MFHSAAFPNLEFQHENAKVFANYWASLTKVDLLPMRSSFDPTDVKDILSNFEIL